MSTLLNPNTADTIDTVVPIMVADRVSKSFGATRALKDVSLTVNVGESHALLGRNGAGKSTLVSIMTGLTLPDTGSVTINGQAAPHPNERTAWMKRVACVYQKSRLVPQLSVAENLSLNTARRNAVGGVSWRWMQNHASSLLEEWDIQLNPKVEAEVLTIAQKRLVELARALSFGCRFVILDEPTAGLDGREVSALLAKIEQLQKRGVTFLYISHHLEETFAICQSATVLRDGQTVLSRAVSELRQSDLVSAMVGSNVDGQQSKLRSKEKGVTREPVLEVKALCYSRLVSDVTFQVRKGEILGLAGLAGSGKGEIARCIAGLLTPHKGAILVNGVAISNGKPGDAIAKGVGFVGHDRHHDGFVVHDSIADNASMSVLRSNARWGLVNAESVKTYARKSIRDLSIKAHSISQPVADLSGGNQQKVVLARALASNPMLLVLVNPLAGVDVASTQVLYSAVSKVADAGAGVLIVSDDLDELAICDAIQVIFKGRLTQRFEDTWRSHDLISAIEGV